MNKRIITLSLMGLLTLGTLTGCSDVKAEKVTTDGQTKEVIVKVGDKNYTADDLFAEYSGTTMKIDDEEFIVIKDEDIISVSK